MTFRNWWAKRFRNNLWLNEEIIVIEAFILQESKIEELFVKLENKSLKKQKYWVYCSNERKMKEWKRWNDIFRWKKNERIKEIFRLLLSLWFRDWSILFYKLKIINNEFWDELYQEIDKMNDFL